MARRGAALPWPSLSTRPGPKGEQPEEATRRNQMMLVV